MPIIRPWGDGWEVLVPDDADWAALLEMPEPTDEERMAAAQRYLQARYGQIS